MPSIRFRMVPLILFCLVLAFVLTHVARTVLVTAADDWLGRLLPFADPRSGMRVAFLRHGDVWVDDPVAGQETRLTADGHGRLLGWTADGHSLFFAKGGTTETALSWNAARGITTVTEGSWSPDGTTVAWMEPQIGGIRASSVWVEANGRRARITPVEPGVRWSPLTWSSDGRRLALARDPVPDGPGSLGVTDGDLLAGHLRSLPLPPPLWGAGGWADVAVWSPDGRYLALGVGPDQSCVSCRVDGVPYYAVPLDDGTVVPLGSALTPVESLSWAPDGSFVVLSETTSSIGRETYGPTQLFRVDLPSGAQHDLSRDPRSAHVEPSVSPDARTIAFVRGRSQHPATGPDWPGPDNTPLDLIATRHIWVMGADGSRPRELTGAPGWADEAPTWTSDGRWIVFVRWRAHPATAELWAVHPDGSGVRRLVADIDVPAGFNEGFGYYGKIDWRRQFAVAPR